MEPDGPRDGISGTTEHSPDRRTAGEGDFAWPPTADDLDRCGIVSLTGDAVDEARLRVLVRLPDVLPQDPGVASRATARTPARPGPARDGRRGRHWGVEQPAAAYPFHVDGDDPMATASAGGEVRRALVALAAGLSLAVLSYVQFRSARADATALMQAVTGTTADTVDRHGPDPVMDVPGSGEPLASATESLERRLIERAAKVTATDAPAGTKLARLAADVVDEVRGTEATDVTPVRAATTDAAPPVETLPEPEPRATAAVIEDRASPAPAPAAVAVTPAVHVDPPPGEPIRRDEDHIRAALTQWRTAYSSLDAGAARAVWPSVDARALERAFQDLKSQDLRFDRCELTVNGGSAQAACRGRAVYVPRFGNQSPKTAPREWTFELEKRDERWTIASARAS
jgi:hypothetical protein